MPLCPRLEAISAGVWPADLGVGFVTAHGAANITSAITVSSEDEQPNKN